MTVHAALQDISDAGQASGRAAALAEVILAGDIGIDDAIGRVAQHLLSRSRVEVVVSVLTSLAPDDTGGWTRLGGRAWIREWTRPGSTRSMVPAPDAGAEGALTMPWLSRRARDIGVVAITDRDLLPPEAGQDRAELARIDVVSFVASSYLSRGEMFGSLSAASLESGAWPDELLQDFRLLNTTISARLTLEHSRRALADAIDAGTEAQLAYQQFFAAVGHELRTPLATVVGYSEVLLDEAAHAPPEDVAAGLLRDGPAILRACEQLVVVVDSLLGAGRTLSGGDHRQDVVLADALGDVVHWHRTPAQIANVKMHVHIDPAETVWAHASAVRQVLTNLLGNAIAHHHAEGGNIHLTTERLLGESHRPMVRIVVRDDGPGLTPDQLQHAFEPFVRFAGPRTKGSGLGLSISRTIAERDGGAVRGESRPGEGSSFWLELPAHAPRPA